MADNGDDSFRIQADPELLAALGRAWWNGLWLGGQMVAVARELGVPDRDLGKTLEPLRRATYDAIHMSSLDHSDQVDLLDWTLDLVDVIKDRNDLGHAVPITDADGLRQLLHRHRLTGHKLPFAMGVGAVLHIAHGLEDAALRGNELYHRIWG